MLSSLKADVPGALGPIEEVTSHRGDGGGWAGSSIKQVIFELGLEARVFQTGKEWIQIILFRDIFTMIYLPSHVLLSQWDWHASHGEVGGSVFPALESAWQPVTASTQRGQRSNAYDF